MLTLHVYVPAGARNIENDFNSDDKFRPSLDDSLNNKNIEAYFGLNNENLVDSPPKKLGQKTNNAVWEVATLIHHGSEIL